MRRDRRATIHAGRALAAQLRDRHGALRAHVDQARGLVDAEAREALLALASIYLQTLEPIALRRVAELTGFLGFDRRDPIAAREHERKVLQTSIRRFEEDARFAIASGWWATKASCRRR